MAEVCEFACPSASACQGACLSDERPPVTCGACDGDGGWEVVDGPDHERGGALTHWSDCRACDGTGETEDPSRPLTEDDAANRDFEIAQAEAR